MSTSYKLYTQNDCPYCVLIREKLDEWGIEYDVINISYDKDAKLFLKEKGHRTVPQLYYEDIHLNKVDTEAFTLNLLLSEKRFAEDGQDWGVESFA